MTVETLRVVLLRLKTSLYRLTVGDDYGRPFTKVKVQVRVEVVRSLPGDVG